MIGFTTAQIPHFQPRVAFMFIWNRKKSEVPAIYRNGYCSNHVKLLDAFTTLFYDRQRIVPKSQSHFRRSTCVSNFRRQAINLSAIIIVLVIPVPMIEVCSIRQFTLIHSKKALCQCSLVHVRYAASFMIISYHNR